MPTDQVKLAKVKAAPKLCGIHIEWKLFESGEMGFVIRSDSGANEVSDIPPLWLAHNLEIVAEYLREQARADAEEKG